MADRPPDSIESYDCCLATYDGAMKVKHVLWFTLLICPFAFGGCPIGQAKDEPWFRSSNPGRRRLSVEIPTQSAAF
jgi:hypothetical protein